MSKSRLLKQYRFGVEQALARASLLNTNDIVTVQAFVLFLVCVRRHDDTRFVWTMTGLAVRIAQSLGLHRDGSRFGLSPFDTEMRRRLWYQVCLVDVRASEDHGSDPSIMSINYDTKLPTNCNDSDLDPDQKEPPQPRHGVSEMTFCLIRFEICSLIRSISYSPPGKCLWSDIPPTSFEEKERMVKENGLHLEKTYLQYCENKGPLYWVAATVARLITAKMSLILYHPLIQPDKTFNLTADTRDRLFMAAIETLEYAKLLEAEAATRKWGWLFATYIQWHAIAYLLAELSIRPNSIIVERAWRAVDTCFGTNGVDIFIGKQGTLWRPLRRLALQARKKRGENSAASLLNNTPLELGISRTNLRPVPTGYPSKLLKPFVALGATMRDPLPVDPAVEESQDLLEGPPFSTNTQIMTDMGLTPEQQLLQQQLQNQLNPNAQLYQEETNPTPWIMDDTALKDLDMDGLDADVDWQGWDELVRDFQFDQEIEMLDASMAPALGAMAPAGGLGPWW